MHSLRECECYQGSTFSPILDSLSLSNFCHSRQCVEVLPWGSDLHFLMIDDVKHLPCCICPGTLAENQIYGRWGSVSLFSILSHGSIHLPLWSDHIVMFLVTLKYILESNNIDLPTSLFKKFFYCKSFGFQHIFRTQLSVSKKQQPKKTAGVLIGKALIYRYGTLILSSPIHGIYNFPWTYGLISISQLCFVINGRITHII